MAKKTTKKKTAKTRKKTTKSTSSTASGRTTTKSAKSRSSSKKTTRKSTGSKKASSKKAAAKSAPKARETSTRKSTTKKSTTKKSTKKSVAKKPKATKSAATKPKKVANVSPDEKPAKREPKLTARDLDHFRGLLLQKRAEILGDVTTLHNEALDYNRSDASGDLSTMPIHMADIGTDNYELEFTLGLIEGERAILREIDEAIERLNNNTFGYCLATGQPIGKARLNAKPWAKYCYEYTLAQERGQTGGL